MFSSRTHLLAIVASVAAGVLLAVMMQVNASLGRLIGPLESSFVVHGVGTVFASLLVVRQLNRDFLVRAQRVPKILYSGGLYGVLLVLIANLIVPQLGMVLSVAIVLTSSLVSSVGADHAGILQPRAFPVNGRRLLGLVCAIGGLILVLKG